MTDRPTADASQRTAEMKAMFGESALSCARSTLALIRSEGNDQEAAIWRNVVDQLVRLEI